MTPKRWFWLAVALQILVLGGMIGTHGFTVVTGEPVRLQSVPVDPWDLFRGEYVTLSYEISRFEPGTFPMEGAPYKRGQTVWVRLRDGLPAATALSVSAERPAAAPGEVVLKGRVEWYHEGHSDPWSSYPGELMIRYGVEQFYVPQGQGPGLERDREQLIVEVKVDRYGRAALSKVFRNGEEVRWR